MPKKLTDMQLVLLSSASQHPDSAIDLAGYPKGVVAKKAITRLLKDRLVEEILTDGTLPVWRRDDGQGAFALRITAHGLAAVGIDRSDTSPDQTAGVTKEAADASPDTSSNAGWLFLASQAKTDAHLPVAKVAGRERRALTGPSNPA